MCFENQNLMLHALHTVAWHIFSSSVKFTCCLTPGMRMLVLRYCRLVDSNILLWHAIRETGTMLSEVNYTNAFCWHRHFHSKSLTIIHYTISIYFQSYSAQIEEELHWIATEWSAEFIRSLQVSCPFRWLIQTDVFAAHLNKVVYHIQFMPLQNRYKSRAAG